MTASGMTAPPCWICGSPATSGEHATKRTDLRSVFGAVAQAHPLFQHRMTAPNRKVGSLDARALKLPARLCGYCNNTRTQPHDRAWEKLSAALRLRSPVVAPGDHVRTNRIFPCGTAREMLNVHLYFVKLFGCHIEGNNIRLDIAGFSYAVMRGKAHPNVYLRFGCGMTFAGKPMTGMSDMWLSPVVGGAMSTFASWFYFVGGFGVNAMFAADGKKRDGLIGAWHPRQGTTRLTIADFRFAKRRALKP
jgi:hypothetical protein